MDGSNLPGCVHNAPDACEKLQFVAQSLITSSDRLPRLLKVAAIFKEWLEENSYVGVTGLRFHGPRPNDRKIQLSSLRPEVLEDVRNIVLDRSLRNGDFLPRKKD